MDDTSSGEIPLEPLPGEEDEALSSPDLTPPKAKGPTSPLIDDDDEDVAAPPVASKAGYLPRIRDYEDAPAPPEPEADPTAKKKPKSKPAARDRETLRPKSPAKPIDRGTEAPRRISEVGARGEKTARPKPRGIDEADDGKKGVLVEQTPEQDTYEYRQRMRMFIAAGFVGVLVLIGIVIWHAASGGSSSSDREMATDGPPTPPPIASRNSPERDEIEANLRFEDAHQFARRKDVKNATRLLTSIIADYPHSPTARLAQEALDRPKRNLPMFVDSPVVVAEETKAAADPAPPKPPEVVVRPPAIASPGESVVDLVPPPTPPEPFRNTGLAMEDAHVSPKPLPPGFRARPGVGVHASGWPWEITCDKDGAAMVLVPGGEFVKGSNNGPSNERPAQKITLGSFYIDQHEVTIGQYQLYVKDVAKKPTVAIPPGPSDLPMTQINARDARDYDRWAGKELPTEAQWEMAGRATDERVHPWGNTPAEWIRPRAAKQVDPVASFPGDLSPYRVFDLAGNAWEWTNDPFVLNAAPASKTKAKSTLVTIKGGSKDWLLAWRDGVPVTSKFAHLGFRGVLSVEGSPAAPNPGQPAAPGVMPQGGSPF